jgi:hypothetical protein
MKGRIHNKEYLCLKVHSAMNITHTWRTGIGGVDPVSTKVRLAVIPDARYQIITLLPNSEESSYRMK